MKFHSLTNTNPLLQEKMQFFADYFSFTNEFLGRLPEIPFENNLSLLNKILFQLNHNQKNCIPYVENYFGQLLSFYKEPAIKKSALFVTVEQGFDLMILNWKTYKNAKEEKQNAKQTWTEVLKQFIQNIKLLRNENLSNFEDSLESAYLLITCKHKLSVHIKEIKFCVHSIVAEFRINGHSQDLVSSYIKKILYKESFPMPDDILDIEDDHERTIRQKFFLENRSFKEQLYGLKNLISLYNRQKGTFIYTIKNCFLEDTNQKSFHVRIDNVTFISSLHKSLKELRKRVKEKGKSTKMKFYSNLFNKSILLAYIELNYVDIKDTQKTGKEYINDELAQLNLYLNTKLAINDDDLIFSKDLSKGPDYLTIGRTNNSLQLVSNFGCDYAKGNAFEQLRNIESNSKNTILQNERTFMKAFAGNDISSYWIYTENLFWNTKFSNPEDQQKRIKNILIKYIENHKTSLISSITLALYYDGLTLEETGLTVEEVRKLYNDVHINHYYRHDYSPYISKVKTGFLKTFFKYLKDFDSTTQKGKWEYFYASTLLELYEYRNMELHSGKINITSQYKLASIVPSILNTIRWALIHGSVQHPELTFEELILELSKSI